MSMKKRFFATLTLSLLAAAFTGCGSGNKEASTGPLTNVGDSACIQCHSSVTDALTNETIVAQYQRSSAHNTAALGCESCHGTGAFHNGVGPIPYPQPDAERCATCHNGVIAPATNANTDFATSNHAVGTPSHTTSGTACLRCHTHEGAVLGNIAGWTGTKDVITDATIQGKITFPSAEYTGINCDTCHEHGGGLRAIKGTTAAGGAVVNWNPNNNTNFRDQFDLCTSCHTLYNYNGSQLLVDGSTLTGGVTTGIVGYHETSWYRIIATTHYDNPNTGVGLASNVVEGYNLRKTGANPCFDCHAHEAKTNTRYAGTDPAVTTIHTDWAQSAHAGRLLAAKYTATTGLSGATAVAAAMVAGSIDDATVGGPGWVHYNWDDTSSRGNCQACHTATGISNYLTTQTTDLTGYDYNNNNFSHLSGWTATGGSPQNELLYCWGCHSNAGTGALRNTSQAIMTFTYASEPIVITDAGKSTACIVCHGGRGSASEAAATDSRSSRFNGHHAPTAGVLYSEKTHIGYEYAGLSYANPSYFAHDKIGANAAGPCASCHMGPATSDGKPSHSFAAVKETVDGPVISNQALCNTCHTPGGAYEITPATLEEESTGYAEASTILNNYVSNLAGYTNYLNLAITGSNYNDLVAVPTEAYGAYQNGKLIGDEPCAYVHNRYYAKRLIFDSIDWMDNGAINGTITIDATTYPEAAAWFGATAGVATRP